jgi:hypothetical protein
MKHQQKAINRSHPYSSTYRPVRAPTLPIDPMLEAEARQERQIASADPMAGRLDELLAELTEANKLGVILTYDKTTKGWVPWFR